MKSDNPIILTGIKPTGTPHIGNYFGCIKPAIDSIKDGGAQGFYFIADYHALTTVKNKDELRRYTREIASVWLACGLDPEKTVFYRQSDVPEIFELSVILGNVTPKGLMNRAHAYKAISQNNNENGREADEDVNMGLYTYPILMAADILAFGSDLVPVGQDQKQHIEIAQDIAKSFNAVFGPTLKIPGPKINEQVAIIPGLDGRKMSKSYGNQIPLFAGDKDLIKFFKSIVTDSSSPAEPKPLTSSIFQMYCLFANADEIRAMKQRFESGIGWGEAKTELFNVANRVLAPMREKYNYYINNFDAVEKVLAKGAETARAAARKTLNRVRTAIGVASHENP